eukprot:TRINITY_DN16155_c0_g1_i11.p2 TRINITY_DN16155_c0_g1~~TRINITY_DN16155_c0_g1_i11.p2  ORF type:complete len:244 (-),score=16.03 TRINITY_DN16155_c0_g1_i11:23-754(-)
MSQKTSGKFLSTKRVEISLTHQNGFYIQHDLAFVTQDILTAVSDLQVFKHLFLVIQIIFVSTRSRFKIFPVQNSSTALIWTALRPQNLIHRKISGRGNFIQKNGPKFLSRLSYSSCQKRVDQIGNTNLTVWMFDLNSKMDVDTKYQGVGFLWIFNLQKKVGCRFLKLGRLTSEVVGWLLFGFLFLQKLYNILFCMLLVVYLQQYQQNCLIFNKVIWLGKIVLFNSIQICVEIWIAGLQASFQN